MATLESGSGQSELATNANNFHGMKANNEWTGASYEKVTKEFKDGKWIEVSAAFKRFDTPESGFMGFGKHLRTRLKGEAYKDAFSHTDPYEFARALVDTTGAQYATDPEYFTKLVPILNRITGKHEEFLPSPVLEMRTWRDLTPKEQQQFGSADEYQKSANQLMLVDTDPKRYADFITNITDLSNYTAKEVEKAGLTGRLYPTSSLATTKPRIVLHYTAWPESAWGHDGKKFVSSIINHALNTGRVGSANQYLGRDGTLYTLTPPDSAANHAGKKRHDGYSYNQETIGVETPAEKQSDITPKQYEGLVYTIVKHWHDVYGSTRPNDKSEMRKFVIGHGEISELHPEVTSHSDFPRAIADAMADLSYHLLLSVR